MPYKQYDIQRKPYQITKKMLNDIDNRRLYALKMNDYTDIQDAKAKVIKIIDDDGLSSDDAKTRLDTSLKVLPYIIPTKKAIETTVIHRKLEDIISESIEEAVILDDTQPTTIDKSNDNNI